MTRMSLELGGKSPVIVLPDVDPDKAALGVANAIFFNQGQVCTAGSRAYIHATVFDDVIERVAKIAASLKIGPGWTRRRRSARSSRRSSASACAAISTRAWRAPRAARDRRPRLLRRTHCAGRHDAGDARRARGDSPVLVAMPFDDVDTAVQLANDTPYASARASGRTIFPRSTSWSAHRGRHGGSTATRCSTTRCRSAG